MFAEGIHGTHTTVGAATRFGNKQTIVGKRILTCPTLEARVVDVGSQQQQLWSSSMPEVDEVGERSCRRILSRQTSSAVHGSIDIERQLRDFCASLTQSAYIFRIVVSHKDLVGIEIGAKHAIPCAFLEVETIRQPRVERLLVFLQ